MPFCPARSLEMRSRFSGVKDCQKGGGAGKAAARGLGACSSIALWLRAGNYWIIGGPESRVAVLNSLHGLDSMVKGELTKEKYQR